MSNKADQLVDKAADQVRAAGDRASAKGGLLGMLGDELADDAAFLRNLKPSLIVARAKGQAPTDLASGATAPTLSLAGSGSGPTTSSSGPNPLLIVGAAFAAGILLAVVIDWRARVRAGE
jgi:hypothetical protein